MTGHPLDRMACAIFTKALADDRAGEILDCLIGGGTVTVDNYTGELVTVTAERLAQIIDPL